MTQLAIQPRFDADAYLACEAGQPCKSEYIQGEVFAMTGALEAHDPFEAGHTIELASVVSLRLPIEDIYEDMRFDPAARACPRSE